ncbi:MAG: bifunctional 4'-phosphopantothenoylcysteine decarboxylase/phosphopantothenoylcysteine synthetase, partial [Armatimonadota bacterium]
GPTHEPIDPVRFLANRSSGKMGYALAEAGLRMGAEVRLITGPTHMRAHPRVSVVRVTTAQEMLTATLNATSGANLLIGAAAVSDFRAAPPSKEKIRRGDGMTLSLVPNPDILATVASQRPELTIVGFAAEAGMNETSARSKMEAKGIAAIFLNDVSRPDVGFDSEDNEGVLLLREGESVRFEKALKRRIAWGILEEVRRLL